MSGVMCQCVILTLSKVTRDTNFLCDIVMSGSKMVSVTTTLGSMKNAQFSMVRAQARDARCIPQMLDLAKWSYMPGFH